MKLKTVLLSAALFSATIGASAQSSPLQFGVKAGANLSNWSGDINDTDAKFGFNVGVTVDYAFNTNWYLMSGLEFTTKGAKIDLITDYTGEYATAKLTGNAMYLQLPIHAGYKLPIAENTNLVFHAGPYLAYGVGGKVTTKIDGFGKVKDDFFGDHSFKRFDFGLGFGAGVEFGKINAGLGYDFGLVNINQGIGTVRNMNGYLSVGYKF